MLGVCGICAGGITHRGNQLDEQHFHGPARAAAIEEALLPPLLIPSKTTHSRMFPQKHSFAYSYLFVGVPVGMTGRTSQALSVDGSPSSWFNIRSSDYLFRDAGNTSLAEKLRIYLEKQGVSDQQYSFAYLVTAPRFMGYSFNPVSFWYIYNGDAELRYMILEVNNTFDERRMYLLRPGSDDDEMDPDDREKTENALYFKETWQKDFHVSPFNSRKGSYSLRAIDPLLLLRSSGTSRSTTTSFYDQTKATPSSSPESSPPTSRPQPWTSATSSSYDSSSPGGGSASSPSPAS